ncbi:MAG: Flp pilus assembly complex ATPase component TadA [Candidatus Aegiribacteria sp.]|nr:Flp pilus assembly complex ATPase component TadA [Candidatus Aegiribacteria sp.]
MLSRLGIMLLESGMVSQDEIDQVIKEYGPGEIELADQLISAGIVPEDLVTEFLSEIYSVKPIYINEIEIDSRLAESLPEDLARKYLISPIKVDREYFYIAMGSPGDLYAVDEVKFATGKEVIVYASAPPAVRRAQDELYGKADSLVSVKDQIDDYSSELDELEIVESLDPEEEEDFESDLEEEYAGAVDGPIVGFVNEIIAKAVRTEISDIHIEPYENYLQIRYRRDGACFVVRKLPKKIQPQILSRFKIMAGMNIAERRKTQDGRIKARIDGRWIDFRVSAVPTVNGEKIVLRILDRGSLEFDLRELGFPEEALKVFMQGVNSPFGIVLVTGPTGSGKTTTLYSALSSLNTDNRNIHTAEEPVEYSIEGLTQTQIDFSMGYDFATALRAILRQDPNIIMVGEIRDLETASIAIKAALTGHLVFSTIHTNDAPSTVNRLVDIGIKPFLVASAVRTIMAQRLVKKICKHCKTPHEYSDKEYLAAGIDPGEMKNYITYIGKGCSSCSGTGYRGRIGLYEVLSIDKNIKQSIIDRVTAGELRTMGVKNGMRTLRMDAVEKLKAGITTLEEVMRVTTEDEPGVLKAAAANKARDKQQKREGHSA